VEHRVLASVPPMPWRALRWLAPLPLAVWLACGEAEAPVDSKQEADASRLADSGQEVSDPAVAVFPRGLWVRCEGSLRVLEHPERIAVLIDDARALGATDLFVQVYRGGRAWFDSSFADAGPYAALKQSTGADTLARLIDDAHAAGLRVHAWVNVLSLAANRNAPLVTALGRDAVMVDQRGRSVLDYPKLEVPQPDRRYYRMGTPAVWLDPGAPGVSEYLADTFSELIHRYPALDGLHLDYIRYPDVLPFSPGSRFGVGLDFGYGEKTRERFRTETGLVAPFGDSLANANAWDQWRRDQVTGLVGTLRESAQAQNPAIELSAAVWTYADRAYLSQGQDWRGWIEDGLIDLAVPMTYTLDDRILRYHAEFAAGSRASSRIWIGLGSWLFSKKPQRAAEQVRMVRELGVSGLSYFSWDAIADTPALRDALVAEATGAP
jgi:uncharacterized lipoprotein YddW (UPF0748 family)